MPAVKNVGEPCAGEPHARFEVAAGGNWALSRSCRASPGASRRPYRARNPRAQRRQLPPQRPRPRPTTSRQNAPNRLTDPSRATRPGPQNASTRPSPNPTRTRGGVTAIPARRAPLRLALLGASPPRRTPRPPRGVHFGPAQRGASSTGLDIEAGFGRGDVIRSWQARSRRISTRD